MLSFECIKNEKSVYFLLTSAKGRKTGVTREVLGRATESQSICPAIRKHTEKT